MAIQHAPYALFGDLVLAYGKTTKTACGKRIRTDQLATRDAATCPDCRRVIASDRAQAAATRTIAEDMLRASGCPHCGEPFDSITAWNQHRIEKHNVKGIATTTKDAERASRRAEHQPEAGCPDAQ